MSREQLLATLCDERTRLQYDAEDEDRLFSLASALTEAAMMSLEGLRKFQGELQTPVDEDSAERMKSARFDVVFAWATLQAAVSKMAYVLRIDGDEAYQRAITAATNDDEPDLNGL